MLPGSHFKSHVYQSHHDWTLLRTKIHLLITEAHGLLSFRFVESVFITFASLHQNYFLNPTFAISNIIESFYECKHPLVDYRDTTEHVVFQVCLHLGVNYVQS